MVVSYAYYSSSSNQKVQFNVEYSVTKGELTEMYKRWKKKEWGALACYVTLPSKAASAYKGRWRPLSKMVIKAETYGFDLKRIKAGKKYPR